MNMKLAGLFGGLMALCALEACLVVQNVDCTQPANKTDPACTGNGGSGGNGTGGDTTSSSSSSGKGGAGGGVGGMAGAGGAPACLGCSGLADGMMGTACAGSQALYDEAKACTCERAAMDAMPGCKDVCLANRCAGMASTPECDKCLVQGACAGAAAACANDPNN